ncbi:MAG TPA: helix-turn-helix transcriptional regulator [Paludibacter sp.]|nr:helix-turn-helix transcriptional regulator [Paludibacter sp.]
MQLNKFRSSDFTKKIFEIVQKKDFELDLTLDLLADRLCIAKSTLCNKLKKETGLSPIEFVRSVKLHLSIQLMSETELSIKEIAYSTGFNDPKYFSRCFKRQFGVTPKEYKVKLSAPMSYKWNYFNLN